MVRWIGDARWARVSDQGDCLTFLQQGERTRRRDGLVVVVIADERSRDAVMRQELAGVTGILSGNHIHAAQDAQGPQGNVLQVTDGGRDDVQSTVCSSRDTQARIWGMKHV